MKAALFADFIIVVVAVAVIVAVVWLWVSRFAACLLITQVTLMGFLNLALESAHRQRPRELCNFNSSPETYSCSIMYVWPLFLGTSSHGDNLADVAHRSASHFPIRRSLLSFMTFSSYLTALGIFTRNWFSSPGIILARSVR